MIIRLSPLQTYNYPVMNWKGIRITEQITYGGDKSVTVPCGFQTTLVYEKVSKNKFDKDLRRLQKKVKAVIEQDKKEALQCEPAS